MKGAMRHLSNEMQKSAYSLLVCLYL